MTRADRNALVTELRKIVDDATAATAKEVERMRAEGYHDLDGRPFHVGYLQGRILAMADQIGRAGKR